MNKDEAIKELEEIRIRGQGDTAVAHYKADDVLLSLLESVGKKEVANLFRSVREDIGFWYA